MNKFVIQRIKADNSLLKIFLSSQDYIHPMAKVMS